MPTKKPYTTKALAEVLDVKPNSIRSAICRTGKFMNIAPRKFPNGRLYFDSIDVDSLLDNSANRDKRNVLSQ